MKAMILAAGRGERMRPLTDRTPKALLCVGGKPLIVRQVERLVAAGVRDLVINHAHLGEQIEAALADGSAYGARIVYSAERAALETAGGIVRALPLLGASPFLVVNADVFSDFDYASLHEKAAMLTAHGVRAHLVLVPNPAHHPHGDFALGSDRSRVTRATPRLTFSGIGLYHPALFDGLVAGLKAPLAPLLARAIDSGQVMGERHDGMWVDVGTPERLRALDAQLAGRDADTPPI